MKLVLLTLALAACGSDPKDPIAELQDPSTCMECHGQHYTQWSGSMHAYSTDDPVFLAMNKRGQRETSGQLGTFCYQCHAPMAVALGIITADNAATFDPSTLDAKSRGITCYFCHNVASVAADHNNGLVLALDDTMRGGANNPVSSPAHNSKYDTTLMHSETNKSTMCGSCHDVVTPAGVALERTYTEWQTTVFAENDPANLLPVTCSGCHMISSTGVIADKAGLNVGSRTYGFHDHSLPAIDQALTTFADTTDQATGVKSILDPALTIVGPRPPSNSPPPGGICLDPPGVLSVRMDTIMIGHAYPSGAGQDRRTWLEVIAYDASNAIVFQSGVVPDGMDPEDINDPVVNCSGTGAMSCSGFWDRIFKADGTPAHFFWEVATETSHLLKPPVTFVPSDPLFDHSTSVVFQIGSSYTTIDHITARLRTLPMNYAMLNDLVSSGDLDPSVVANMKVLDSSGGTRTWSVATKGMGPSMFTNCSDPSM